LTKSKSNNYGKTAYHSKRDIILLLYKEATAKERDKMTDNELLLAISDMMDKKLKSELQPIKNRLDRIENNVTNISLKLENEIQPQLDTITSCYSDTYNRYKDYADRMESVFDDVDLLRKVVSEHSQKLQSIS